MKLLPLLVAGMMILATGNAADTATESAPKEQKTQTVQPLPAPVPPLPTSGSTRRRISLPRVPALTSGDYTYITNANGQATVTGFNRNYSGELAITNSLRGCPVTAISRAVFTGCTGITSVILPASITSISLPFTSPRLPGSYGTDFFFGGSSFIQCPSLTNIMVEASNPAYRSADGVLFNKEQTVLIGYPPGKAGSYRIPDKATGIGGMAFYRCTGLTSVTIPNSVTRIGYSAFCGCTSLTNVTIPSTLTNIESSAFAGCTSLTNAFFNAYKRYFSPGAPTPRPRQPTFTSGDYRYVTNATGQATIISFNRNYTGALAITNSLDGRPVTGISPIAFMNCTGLTSVSLPACITNILITFGSPFTSIKGLTAIDVDGANPNYRSVDGVFFNKEQAALLQFPASRAGSYRIPDTVTTILSGAFRNASLTSVTIPDSVAQIGNLAFSDCIGLTNVTIPAHLTNIASNAFYGCTGLTNAFFKAYSKAPRFRAASAASSASRQQTIEGLKQILGNTSDPAAKERLENLISMLERAEAGKSGTPSSTNSPTGRIYISPNASTNISVQTATAVRKPDGKWIVQFPNGNQMDMESYAARHGGVKNAIEHIKELMPGETNPDRLAYRKEQIKALEAMQAAGMK